MSRTQEPDTEEPEAKPLFWMGTSRDDLRECPPEVRRVIGFALRQAQLGGKHVHAKPLKGQKGAGVLEVVSDYDTNTYRGVYTVKFPGAVYVLHVFQKKSKSGVKTPKPDLDAIARRLATAKEHYADWISQQRAEGRDGDAE